MEDLEFSESTVAIYAFMAQVVGIAAQPVMGFLSDRLGRKFVLVPTMAVMGALFIALRFADPGVQLVFTILATGAFLYSLHTIFIAAAMDVAGGEVQSTVVSLIYGAGFLGTASPILAGVIADASGDTRDTFLFGGAVVLLAAAILLLLKLPRTASQAAKSPGH